MTAPGTIYRLPPGTAVTYSGVLSRKHGWNGRIIGPHTSEALATTHIPQRETYDVDWGDRIRTEFAGCLTARTMLHTDELREGDIVINSGMRILIDGPAKIYGTEYGNDPAVYSWPGLVLNADDLCDKDSENYDAYIARHLRGIWWEDRVPRPHKDNWTITGNHCAMWHIEPKGPVA